jgi:hypothetical protein
MSRGAETVELSADDSTLLSALAECCRSLDGTAEAYLRPAAHLTIARSRPSIVVPRELLPPALARLRGLVRAWRLEGDPRAREGLVHLCGSSSREANMLRRALMTRGRRSVFTSCEILVNDTGTNGAIIAERLKLLTLIGRPSASLDVPAGVVPLAAHLRCADGSVAGGELNVRLADGAGPLRLSVTSTTSSVVTSGSCLYQRTSNPSFVEVLRLVGVDSAGAATLQERGIAVRSQEAGVTTLAPGPDYARVEEVLRRSGARDFGLAPPEEFLVGFESLGEAGAGEVLEETKAELLREAEELEAAIAS